MVYFLFNIHLITYCSLNIIKETTANYLGCFHDGDPKNLNDATISSESMTHEMCETFCGSFSYYALQNRFFLALVISQFAMNYSNFVFFFYKNNMFMWGKSQYLWNIYQSK